MSLFVAIDGPDGCGKSTQAGMLVEELRAQGADAVHLREPGSTPFGERVRGALLDPVCGHVDALTEALAFSAARRAMLEREVAPALERGAVVVAERCFLSTVVYQCRAPVDAPAPEDLVRDVTRAVHDHIAQDLVLILDVDQQTAMRRARDRREPDRIEGKSDGFHERVRRGFLELAGEASWVRELLARRSGADERVQVIDASRSIDAVHADVVAAARAALARVGGPR